VRIVAAAAVLAVTGPAVADSTAGIDGALFRSSYDTGGVFALEGARLLPKRDLSLKFLVGYGRSPVAVAVPGIGDADSDRILEKLLVLDLAFALTLTDRFALGIGVGAYRTQTGDGYGDRGRLITGSGNQITPGTGLVALRRISNLDPGASPGDSSSYLGDGRAGPLDARLGGKLALLQRPTLAVALVGSVFLPFGEDEMLLGDRSLVFEPKLALEWKPSAQRATRVIANAAARIRRRTVLESFETGMTDLDAKVFLDVGSEAVAGLGAVVEVSPRVHLGAEAQLFLPLPASASYGGCRSYLGTRCEKLAAADYFNDARSGDLAMLATAGVELRLSADVTLLATASTSQLGARGDDLRLTTGLVWAPQPLGASVPGRNDRDGDGISDSLDACRTDAEDKDGYQDEDGCPDEDNDRDGLADAADQCRDEPEDKDGFEDADGCPERDNDNDGVLDAIDRCPDQKEDVDSFDDQDGCPDDDNDQDGIPDARDRCPLEAETKNGFEDDDGCPDNRGAAAPTVEERGDRLAIVGGVVSFAGAALTPASKALLDPVAALLKAKKLLIRVEVHVPRTTRPRADKVLAQQRAKAVADYLVSQGLGAKQVQALGLGSDRPLASISISDQAQARVELVKR
jgi:outer membrane protein OmpA-like peptidoglycan-associated protein